jgi:ribosome-associated toxin RatA of RatAB toxin-antitoxin module
MTTMSKTALLPYSAMQLYNLALNVADYPLFLPWCTAVVVHEQNEFFQDATLKLHKGVWHDQFRTHNTLVPAESIQMRLVEGPFKKLSGQWVFQSLGEKGSQVALHLEFEMKLGPLQAVLEMTFKQMTQSILQAFCQRAHQVYGLGSS